MLNIKNLGEYAEFLVRGVEHRAELAVVEFTEARDAAISSAGLFLAASGLFLMAGMAFSTLIVAAFWNTPYRLPSLAGIGILYVLAGYLLLIRARTRLEACRGFSETADQLKKDMSCLAEVIQNR